ncbi:hypothetical protein SAMN04488071_1344 [Kordiimonas lacus]|uniref:PH domain-containing protein n=2 Tax=Kordiimonas lacus TaxID=637679 RepID=A0A1G6XUP2_9PROT|nr:hypothetical protein SAMN04488071_1344 [Kordiimonas lacus]
MNFYSQELNAELGAGEKLIWAGGPKQGIYLTQRDFFLIPISLSWLGTAVAWEYSVWTDGGHITSLLFGGVLVAIGLFMTFGRFIDDCWRRSKTIYGLSERRAIILEGRNVKSVQLSSATTFQFYRHNHGRGTIQFGVTPEDQKKTGVGALWAFDTTLPTFEQIEDGERVYAEIKRIVGL